MLAVLVIAADPLARAGLAALLSAHVTVLAELSPEDALEPFLSAEVDALVCDSEGELDLTSFTAQDIPLLAVVAEDADIAGALAAGASGVLSRTADGERLVAALTAISAGLVVLEPAFVEALPIAQDEPSAPSFDDLTARELEVLQLLSEGLSNKAIAKRLEISDHTVKFHVNALLSKFGASTRTEVVMRAVRSGLLTL